MSEPLRRDTPIMGVDELKNFVTTTAPTIRVRMNHDFTTRDGWRLKETTVEWEGSAFGLEPEALTLNLMEFGAAVYNAGMREANLRNDASRDAAAQMDAMIEGDL